jgi:hypothetical protein
VGLAFCARWGDSCSGAGTFGKPSSRPQRRILETEDGLLMNFARQPYAPPRLRIYGSLEELTLTATISKNKNDSLQGGNNLKT